MYWHQALERLEAGERDRQAWVEDVKHRLGIRCIGDRQVELAAVDVPEGAAYRVISDETWASCDGVTFYRKPDWMGSAEFFAAFKRPG